MKEIWKVIKGYEGLYEVSSYGNIRNKQGRLLRLQRSGKGYLGVSLSKGGVVKQLLAHRLVAFAFIENPNNKPEVNHINENKQDNTVENLEWVTREENATHGTCLRRGVEHRNQQGEQNPMFGRKGSENPNSKKVNQFKDGFLIRMWDSIKDIERELGFNSSAITQAAKGKIKQAYGFEWRYHKPNNINS